VIYEFKNDSGDSLKFFIMSIIQNLEVKKAVDRTFLTIFSSSFPFPQQSYSRMPDNANQLFDKERL